MATTTTTTTTTSTTRAITKIVTATRQQGPGFIVSQAVPHRALKAAAFDPFLMVDAFGPMMMDHRFPGTPWHPHRGFDTVTYILHGESQHQDSMGNKGVIKAGEVQWMRAGSGIIHDEGQCMKRDDPPRRFEGFQIWMNLPSHMKMSPPNYMQLTAETFVWRDLATAGSTGSRVKLIAGRIGDAMESPLTAMLAVPVFMADVRIAPNGVSRIPLDDSFDTVMVYCFEGRARVFNGEADAVGTAIARDDLAVYSEEPGAVIVAALADAEYPPLSEAAVTTTEGLEQSLRGHRGASVLVLAGKKIQEPIARHGPFVMNTDAELKKAFEDFHSGKFATVKASENLF